MCNVKANIDEKSETQGMFELNLEPYSTLMVVAISEE